MKEKGAVISETELQFTKKILCLVNVQKNFLKNYS